VTYRKKLIEVALPLEAVNAASAREKSIRHGHASILHLWWARRPVAACRAVLFAQRDGHHGHHDSHQGRHHTGTKANHPVRLSPCCNASAPPS
jgi:Protein of unknown function (DUF1156)